MDNFSLTDLIYFIILIIIVSWGGIYYAIKKKKTYIPNIIDLEKRRKAHPDMQTGRFNRIYTMPYDDEVNAYTIRKYLEEHKDQKDKPDGMSDAEWEDWEG